MNKTKPALFALLSLLLSGCMTSLYPLFTDADKIFDPALAGVWQDDKHENTFTIQWFPDGKLYFLHTEMKEQLVVPGEFNAGLGTIGKHRFLNIVPRRPKNIPANSFYGGHFLQTFSFWKVELDGDKLTLTPLSHEWLKAMLKEKKLDIKTYQPEGGFITLTASTEELKAFVLKYADDKSAFSSGLHFERKK